MSGRLRINVVDDEIIVALRHELQRDVLQAAKFASALAKRIANKTIRVSPDAMGISRSCLENCQRQGARAGVDCIKRANFTGAVDGPTDETPTMRTTGAWTPSHEVCQLAVIRRGQAGRRFRGDRCTGERRPADGRKPFPSP